MKEKYKWMLITSIIVVIIALILGFLLKNHYDKGQEKQQGREHVQINNKNVKLFQILFFFFFLDQVFKPSVYFILLTHFNSE